MYNQHNVPPPEYRVRTVARYVVTRYCHPYVEIPEGYAGDHPVSLGSSGSSEVIGEFENEQRAFEVAQAMAGTELVATVSV